MIGAILAVTFILGMVMLLIYGTMKISSMESREEEKYRAKKNNKGKK